MINQCLIEYHCNLKNIKKCKYYKSDDDKIQSIYQSCIHLYGCTHCINTIAIREALKDEIEDILNDR